MTKPVYLAVLGISIVVAAISLGVTLTRYLGLVAYSPKGTAQAAATPAVRNVPATPPEEWNNLFAPEQGMNLPSRLPTANAQSASQAARTMFVLVGTIVSSSPDARRAILWANGMKEPKAFREKEEVEPGALLSSIERDKVWISRGKDREKLDLLPVGSRVRPTATAAPVVVPSVAAAAPTPAKAQAVAAPDASSGEEANEGPSALERRRRARGVGR
jgi:type II secretory pathway component PulC